MSENLSSSGKRKFHDLPQSSFSNDVVNTSQEDCEKLLQFISNDVIGKNYKFDGPFGRRHVTYCDYTASGRALTSVEQYVNEKILPVYGNTHTSTTVTSLQSSMFLQEARMMIRNAVRATEHDAVIFVGNGVTGAINKLIHSLNFDKPPVVFVGPFEHHSNLLPWREIAAHVVYISEDHDGSVNLKHLESALKLWKSTGLQLVGCFSAASNVTGIISDSVKVSALLHQYGCLSLWDYATAGPYLNINLHPQHTSEASKDAVFLSMHKFVGGVDSPGVLIAKKSLFRHRTPSECGGGAVFFVSRQSHRFLQDVEMREEAGTIRVVGAVRAALAFKLKQSVGTDIIMQMEEKYRRRALQAWREIPQMKILGANIEQDHLAIFSFLIAEEKSGRYLHHNYVAALLNDLFGIQTRGGCACAGPYAQNLLGIDEKLAQIYENLLLEDNRLDRTHLRRQMEYSQYEILRPGFTRLNFSYFCGKEEADYVTKAVSLVARHGWKLLPQYMFNCETGEWHHTKHKVFSDRRWIEHTQFAGDGLKVTDPKSKFPLDDAGESKNYAKLLEKGEAILLQTTKQQYDNPSTLPDHSVMFSDQVKPYRWFLLPSEALAMLNSKQVDKFDAVFVPRDRPTLVTDEQIEQQIKIPENLLENIEKMSMRSKENEHGINGKPKNGLSESFDDFLKQKTNGSSKSEPVECDTGVCFLKPRKVKETNDGEVTKETTGKKKRKWVYPPKSLLKPTKEAIEKYKMIYDGDKVLVGLSGGKDSLSLLHVLHQYQYYARANGVNFELGAVTIDPMTSAYDPSPLIGYLAELGVTYFYERQNIFDQAMEVSASSICSFCSRMKRGRLYTCLRREGWNVLALGQHLDDLAESFIMSSFHNGKLFTMKANYYVKEGDLRVIRPFVHIRETQTRHFAESNHLPVIPENCPACFEAPKERHRVKQLLASQEILHPNIFNCLRTAMEPLMMTGLHDDKTSRSYDDEDADS